MYYIELDHVQRRLAAGKMPPSPTSWPVILTRSVAARHCSRALISPRVLPISRRPFPHQSLLR